MMGKHVRLGGYRDTRADAKLRQRIRAAVAPCARPIPSSHLSIHTCVNNTSARTFAARCVVRGECRVQNTYRCSPMPTRASTHSRIACVYAHTCMRPLMMLPPTLALQHTHTRVAPARAHVAHMYIGHIPARIRAHCPVPHAKTHTPTLAPPCSTAVRIRTEMRFGAYARRQSSACTPAHPITPAHPHTRTPEHTRTPDHTRTHQGDI
jgi:hypothetical protein